MYLSYSLPLRFLLTIHFRIEVWITRTITRTCMPRCIRKGSCSFHIHTKVMRTERDELGLDIVKSWMPSVQSQRLCLPGGSNSSGPWRSSGYKAPLTNGTNGTGVWRPSLFERRIPVTSRRLIGEERYPKSINNRTEISGDTRLTIEQVRFITLFDCRRLDWILWRLLTSARLRSSKSTVNLLVSWR